MPELHDDTTLSSRRHFDGRRRLSDLIARLPNSEHVLLSAPPGFGKSTLIRNWHMQLADKPAPAICVEAAKCSDEEFGSFLYELLSRIEKTVGVMPKTDPVTVFVDDIQHLTDEQAVRLGSGLAAEARVVLGGSHQVPDDLLWALGENVLVLGEDDLSYTIDETVAVLSQYRTSGSSVAQIEDIHRQTKGWPFVIGLLRSRFLREPDGIGLKVTYARSEPSIMRFLDEHLFRILPNEVMGLLAALAPLDRFCGGLAHAVTGSRASWSIIERFERLGVPLTRSGPLSEWIALHPIILTYLRQRYPPGNLQLVAIHRAAADWYAGQGHIGTAVEHALLAKDPVSAARIIDASGGWQMVLRGDGQTLSRVFESLDEQSFSECPSFAVGLALHLGRRGDLPGARSMLSRLASEASTTQNFRDELLVVESILDGYEDRPFDSTHERELRSLLARRGEHDALLRAAVSNVLAARYLQHSRFHEVITLGGISVQSYDAAGAAFGACLAQCHVIQAHQFLGQHSAALDLIGQTENAARILRPASGDLLAILEVLKAEILVKDDAAAATELICTALATVENGDAWHDILAAAYRTVLALPEATRRLGGREAVIRRAAMLAGRKKLPRLMMLVAVPAEEPLRSDLLARLPQATEWAPDPRRGIPVADQDRISDREAEVLGHMADGLTIKEMAVHMGISENTVKYHAKRLYARLGTNRRSLVIRKARELHLI